MSSVTNDTDQKLKVEVSKAGLADYDASQITALKGLAPVRERPAMYIGSTGPGGLHHLVWEIVDNSIDEHMAGFGSELHVTLHNDGSLSVQDFGRGIPTDIHPTEGVPGVELALTTLHAGGKFDAKSAYGKSGGLHGVGAACVNALSTKMEVFVEQKGKKFRIEFSRGDVTEPLSVVGTSKRTGTYVRFYPDPEIFKETVNFSHETIATRLRQTAFLNAGLKLVLRDERPETPTTETFFAEEGVAEYVRHLNRSRKPLHDVVHFRGEVDDIDLDIALQFHEGYSADVYSFANNIRTNEGGTHLTGFKSALTRVVKEYITENANKNQKTLGVEGDDTLEGITAVVTVRVRDAQFEGQTKGKLNNTEVRGVVEGFLTENLRTYFSETPKTAKLIMEKVLQAAKAREASRKARDLNRKKSALEAGVLPGKLADCSSNNPEENEVYLVEGDSAGGSAKQGRDRKNQAILPLKGKILNVEKADMNKILANDEIRAIITCLGTGIGAEFDISNLRYHKVIIMTDADVDGSHIKTLILTLFFRHFREMVERGHVYLAMPPLYRVAKGKTERYAITEAQREAAIEELGGNEGKGLHIQRYKGLGEMNPEQLYKTTMNPQTRTLQKVNIEDAMLADELFSQLMGDDVESRRNFIELNATYAKHLDV